MDWLAARERLRSPVFAPLSGALLRLDPRTWPTHEALSALAGHATTSRGVSVRFVAPRQHAEREKRSYERRIASTGEIETRDRNWHDLFNALVWIAFPKAKAAVNAQHAAMLEERGDAEALRRGPERDALTVFDEGGVVVLSSAPETFELIRAFEWKELFWHRRERLLATTRFLAFGHALYEKALDPFIGMVAKTVFVKVDAAFASLDIAQQLAIADAALAAHFADRANFSSAKAMAPMPVLGIPGWHLSTAVESFYDDPVHFRKQAPRA